MFANRWILLDLNRMAKYFRQSFLTYRQEKDKLYLICLQYFCYFSESDRKCQWLLLGLRQLTCKVTMTTICFHPHSLSLSLSLTCVRPVIMSQIRPSLHVPICPVTRHNFPPSDSFSLLPRCPAAPIIISRFIQIFALLWLLQPHHQRGKLPFNLYQECLDRLLSHGTSS